MECIIELHKVTKKYGRRTVFKALSGRFVPGKSYVISGPNGSGKSTLLRIICGLLRPSSGEVQLQVEGRSIKETCERGTYIGYLSPELNLYDRLTAFENLAFFASLKGLAVDESYIEELLERVQLERFTHLATGTFSSGMKQRLKLAFALLHRPPVLILDEPTTNLDDRGKKLVAELIGEQRHRGMAIIASNEPGEVEKYGQEIYSLGDEAEIPGVEGPGRRV